MLVRKKEQERANFLPSFGPSASYVEHSKWSQIHSVLVVSSQCCEANHSRGKEQGLILNSICQRCISPKSDPFLEGRIEKRAQKEACRAESDTSENLFGLQHTGIVWSLVILRTHFSFTNFLWEGNVGPRIPLWAKHSITYTMWGKLDYNHGALALGKDLKKELSFQPVSQLWELSNKYCVTPQLNRTSFSMVPYISHPQMLSMILRCSERSQKHKDKTSHGQGLHQIECPLNRGRQKEWRFILS